jgi:hypothetical protein
MTTYTDAFGSETIPPSEYQYRAVALTADVTLGFPSVSEGTDVLSSIMDVTASAGPFTITLPDATNGSNGQDVLIRNVGAESFEVNDNAGGAVATIAAGEVKYLYLTDNSTAAGAWSVFTFGTGTSAADASALAGAGLSALANRLVASATVNVTASTVTMTAEDSRAEVYVFTGGSVSATLPTVVLAGNGWYVDISNQGLGAITVTNSDGALIDGAATKELTPTESCRLYTDGSAWYSIGFGRSVDFVFTKLVKDISVGSPFTLTSAEASNKLLQFIGSPVANVVVNVPTVVSIYYVQCSYTGAYTLEIKTSAGTGVTLQNTDRTILYCDGVNVVAAQTVTAGSNFSIVDGTAASPAINFSADTDTGIYRAGTNSFGIAAGGVQSAVFTSTGINDTPIGATTRRTGAFTDLALTNPLPVASGGTGSATAGAAPFALKGANTDITSLTGLTGAISGATTLTISGTATLGDSSSDTHRINGNIGINSAPSSLITVVAAQPITGAISAHAIQSAGVIQSDVTATGSYYLTSASTAAGAYTVTNIIHYLTNQGTFGAGSSVTSQSGFWAHSGLTGATNNYGFRGQLAAAAGRWNLFMDGTANNAIAGSTSFGSTTAPTSTVDITGSLAVSLGASINTLTLTTPLSAANGGTGIAGVFSVGFGDSLFSNGVTWVTGPLQSFKNKIIGGDFTTNPWQRGTSFAAIATNAYCADRWKTGYVTTAVTTITKTADAPIFLEAATFSQHCLHVDVTTADAAVAAGDYYALVQSIEGYNVSNLGFGQAGTRYVTLSFWHKHTKTGTNCVSLTNATSARSYIREYTQAVSDTWEYSSLTFPIDTTGTWLYDNGVGLIVRFALMGGTTFQSTAGSWQAGNFTNTSSQVNNLDNVANNFKIALVQLEQGENASLFESLSIQEVQSLCERYYQESATGEADPVVLSCNVTTATVYQAYKSFKSVMRAAPTVAGTNASNTNFGAAVGTLSAGIKGFSESRTSTGTGPGGWITTWTATAEL